MVGLWFLSRCFGLFWEGRRAGKNGTRKEVLACSLRHKFRYKRLALFISRYLFHEEAETK